MNVLNGTSFLIWIDTVTPLTASSGSEANYRPVVCGISNGFGMDIESISTRNKCDGGYDSSEAGYLSWNFDFDGQAVGVRNSEKAIKANFQEIAILALNKVTFWAKMDDIQGSVTREGKVRITSHRETANLDSPYSFTANFIGIGKPILATNIFNSVLATNAAKTGIFSNSDNKILENKDGN